MNLARLQQVKNEYIGGIMTITVKEYLRRKKIRQISIAKKMKMDEGRLSKFFSGWVDIPEWRQKDLARVIGITLKELQTDSVKKERLGVGHD